MFIFQDFFQTYFFYIQELWAPILIGFLISGIFNEFISTDFVQRSLGTPGFRPIFVSSLIGVLLPVCCFGSLPIAMTLRRKGARLGPVLAFLVTTPATSISALIVCWKLLGWSFTIYIFWAVIVMGVIMGVLMNRFRIHAESFSEKNDSCCHDSKTTAAAPSRFLSRTKGILYYSLLILPKEIGLELLLGVAIASFIAIFTPLQQMISEYLVGLWGYVAILAVGLSTYVCSTASVPMTDALMKAGAGYGPAMTYLLVGPITSYGTILVLKKEFGGKLLILYLFMISILSIFFGVVFERFLLL